jgi:phage shock protein C
MSRNTEQDEIFTHARPQLRLDRANRKLLGVCGGFARYLDVPAALVRVIYCVACLASPFLILIYFVLYWLLEDDERPARIKAAISGLSSGSRQKTSTDHGADLSDTEHNNRADSRRFDIKRPLYRSRSNVRLAGVCAGIADYLGVSTFIVRLLTFISLFILGGVTLWGYVIFWIVLDKEPKADKNSGNRGSSKRAHHATDNTASDYGHTAQQSEQFGEQVFDNCAATLHAAERRLREAEAFITSKQFRLHCEINRI